MSKGPKDPDPKSRDQTSEIAVASPLDVTLPPIDAEPEEIAQTLFQRSPLKKLKDEDGEPGAK